MLHQSTSLRAIAMCAVVVTGFFVGVDQEGDAADLSKIGIVVFDSDENCVFLFFCMFCCKFIGCCSGIYF